MRRVGETLESLEHVVVSRKSQPSLESYTSRLFSGGVEKIGEKVTEEAGELVAAAKAESAERVVSEAADLLYHMLVLLAFREVPLAQVEDELARRFGISGLEEKASRKARAPGVPQANGGEST
ncbi:MAG: phosphoribosyl-ATP diphosphatase [Planctomycetota bacterium]|jgi:phosphoribosyl-ATP pyrophosphohydrolase|nr:MAG: phosphoribosyl-ATP diphosphatase [Planctomycetota bacterium]